MSETVDPHNESCPQCGEPLGDHKLRDWIAHTDVGSTTMPFESVQRGLVSQMGLHEDTVLADYVDVRSLVAETAMGPIGFVEMHFQTGRIGEIRDTVARVTFMGPPTTLRACGRLLNDSFNRAAHVASGGR